MDISQALYRWAKGKPENRAQLETWQTAALNEIASGKGKDVANTSANGVSVSFAGNATVADWFSALSTAIQFLDSPPVTSIRGRVR